MEQAKEGATALSGWAGKAAGAGVTVVGVGIASEMGHTPPTWMAVVATGATMAVGGFVQKVAHGTIDKLNAAGGATGGGVEGGNSTVDVMARLSEVLKSLDQVSQIVTEAVDMISLAQGRVLEATRGSGNELARVANGSLRTAPRQLREGMADLKAGQELVGRYLLRVAGGHG